MCLDPLESDLLLPVLGGFHADTVYAGGVRGHFAAAPADVN
jgi:hypothetical protein